jgi:hypothetical protein
LYMTAPLAILDIPDKLEECSISQGPGLLHRTEAAYPYCIVLYCFMIVKGLCILTEQFDKAPYT